MLKEIKNYISQFPEEVQEIMHKIRDLILEAVPEAYQMFDKKKDGMVKVIIKPTMAEL